MMDAADRKWLRDLLADRVVFDAPMARHTSLRIGGPADALAFPATVDQLIRLVCWTRQKDLPLTVIGGGTNVLVSDKGIRGVTVGLKAIATPVRLAADNSGGVLASAHAGVQTRHICALALKKGLAGMNFALGIPGTLGGAIRMNAGTSAGQMAGVLAAVTVLTPAGQVKRYPRWMLEAGYRKLDFPVKEPLVILEAEIRLSPASRQELYAEACRLMRRRAASQPTWKPSAGCFFKNPAPDKPAGMLIDQAGLKGAAVGDAQVSTRHANFIFNAGRATAAQVMELANRIQETVRQHFGIILEPEVKIIGET